MEEAGAKCLLNNDNSLEQKDASSEVLRDTADQKLEENSGEAEISTNSLGTSQNENTKGAHFQSALNFRQLDFSFNFHASKAFIHS